MSTSFQIPEADLAALRRKAQERGVLALRAFGSSMTPCVRPGDWLLVRRASPICIRCGDVVAFVRGDRIYVHRVVRKRAGEYSPLLVTRGDALAEHDLPVSAEELLGRVACVVRGFKTINLEGGSRSVVERLVALWLRLRDRTLRLATALGCFPRPVRGTLATLLPARPMSAPTAEVVRQLVGLSTHPSPVQVSEVRSWDTLLALGCYHGVLPLLYRKLEGFDLPEGVRSSLRQYYTANLARNLRLRAEQEALLAAFETARIPVIPLKGVRWAEEFYGDLALRVIDDLDLLVQPADRERADCQLYACGFAPLVTLRERQLQSARSLLYRKGTTTPIFLDLHLRLLPYGREDPFAESLWRDGPSRETRLLYLCLNFYAHRFARLKLALDLVAFLERNCASLDWELLAARAEQYGFTRLCYYSLHLVALLSERQIPALERLRPAGSQPRWAQRLLGVAPADVFARADRLAGPYGTLVLLACQQGFVRRVALLRHILFPTSSAIRQDYWHQPQRSLAACYLDRWLHKGTQAARHLTAAVFSRP